MWGVSTGHRKRYPEISRLPKNTWFSLDAYRHPNKKKCGILNIYDIISILWEKHPAFVCDLCSHCVPLRIGREHQSSDTWGVARENTMQSNLGRREWRRKQSALKKPWPFNRNLMTQYIGCCSFCRVFVSSLRDMLHWISLVAWSCKRSVFSSCFLVGLTRCRPHHHTPHLSIFIDSQQIDLPRAQQRHWLTTDPLPCLGHNNLSTCTVGTQPVP